MHYAPPSLSNVCIEKQAHRGTNLYETHQSETRKRFRASAYFVALLGSIEICERRQVATLR